MAAHITISGLVKIFLTIILIPIGLLSKYYNGPGSEFINNNLGGAIYVVFFIILASLVFPNAGPLKISLIVLFSTCLIEFSQLLDVAFLSNLRKNSIIRLLIGTTYNSFDFVFYFLGFGTGYIFLSKFKVD